MNSNQFIKLFNKGKRAMQSWNPLTFQNIGGQIDEHSCISDSALLPQVLNISQIVFTHRFIGCVVCGGFNESCSRKVRACYPLI